MSTTVRLLIVGGYGTFGGRIVELLEDEPRLCLIVAGRSQERATAYCQARRKAKARLEPAALDRTGDLAAQLTTLRPDILVDASGPFQAYGGDPYGVIRACIDLGINYLDLADGSDFVDGVQTFNAVAQAAGVYVLSGVSSFPVLTAAVVRRLAHGMARIDAIRGGIAPSPYASVGANVIRAIASYAGQRTSLVRNGKAATGHPFAEQLRFTIGLPGRMPLQSRLFSLVDVPDLRELHRLWPKVQDIWMGAAPVPEVLHRLLIGLAWLVRLGLISSLLPLAPLIHIVSNHLRWGEHRGGMFVEVLGADASGRSTKRTWHLVAEGDDGPLIPSMAVEALVRRALDGLLPPTGVRSACGELELEAYEALFARRMIHTAVREASLGQPLYRRLLGPAWDELPSAIRAIHTVEGTVRAIGCAEVERGSNLLARLIGALAGFPKVGKTSVNVRFDASEAGETWTRTFGADSFSSRQFAGTGRSEGLLCERFGPFVFAMALVLDGSRLRLVVRRWSLLGLPLPMWLGPRSNAYETEADGRFCFHVDIRHPIAGPIVRYCGWLASPQP